MTIHRNIVFAFFAAVMFAGAFLMFAIQPMIAKPLLPLFGGSPSVWNVCLLTYQGLLLAGYACAVAAQKNAKIRIFVPALLICAALAVLPVGAPSFSGSGGTPAASVAWALLSAVGLPFFVLAAASPLLQVWYVRAAGREPYALYSFSNAGSLMALAAYPLLIEPRIALQTQEHLWSMGFAVYAVGVCVCLFAAARSKNASGAPVLQESAVSRSKAAFWIAAAFVPSSLMQGVTTFITLDLPPSPLMWSAPLGLYLLSFVLAFSKWNKPVLNACLKLRPAAAAVFITMYVLSFLAGGMTVPHLVVSYVMMQICAGVLADSRPKSGALTRFYLCVAAGGALGGVFNALLAPVLFNAFVEYPLTFLAAMLFSLKAERQNSWQDVWRDFALPAGIFFLSFGLLAAAHLSGFYNERIAGVIVVLMIGGLVCSTAERPLRCALTCGVLILFGSYVYSSQNPYSVFHAKVLQKRNFFGVVHVRKEQSALGRRTVLFHGTTLHGLQYARADARKVPQLYYSPSSGAGEMFRLLKKRGAKDVAVVGMGTAALSAYAEPEQNWTYYEIDPLIVSLNTGMSPVFTYFSTFTPDAEVKTGDGRVLLSQEDKKFDLIVLDAFSSDSIPTHLMTKEALEVYLNRLKKDGALLFHTTNRFLDLRAVLTALGANLNLAGASFTSMNPEDGSSVTWVVLTRSKEIMSALQKASPDWKTLPEPRRKLLWTDDYANVPAAIKRKRKLPVNNRK